MAPKGVLLLKRVEQRVVEAVLLGGVMVSSKHVEEFCILHCTSLKAPLPCPHGESLNLCTK